MNGRGGVMDRAAAMRLFHDAAARGHKGAHYALRVLAAESAAAEAVTAQVDVSVMDEAAS